jgi:hypothetical protein
MEWVLQFVDEIDDAIGVVRHGWLGLHAELEELFAGTRGSGGPLRSQDARLKVHD